MTVWIVRFAHVAIHAFNGPGKHLSKSIIDSLGYDAMGIGALTTVLYRSGQRWLLKLANTWLPHVGFAALVVLHILNKLSWLSLLGAVVTSVVTALFIVSQIAGKRKLINLENRVFDYIGKISFGIYIYHLLVITIIARLFHELAPNATLPALVVVLLVCTVTLVIAATSYRYLEKPFLRIKDRLARVKSSAARTEK